MTRRFPRTALAAALCVIAAAGVSGCGFQPLYGTGSAGSGEQLASIRVEPMPNRSGQQLRNMLTERLSPQGTPSRPVYLLSVSLTEGRQDLAVRQDETATRSNLIVTANFALVPADSRDLRQFVGRASSTNSYNRLRSDFATLSAEEDARTRALRTLAEEIRLRVAAALANPDAYITTRPPSAPSPPPASAPPP